MTGTMWWFRDSWEMVLRNLIHIRRTPELLLDVTLSPIMFVLLFNFVFAGAINVGAEGGDQGSYINYMMAGIFVQTIAFAGIYTSVLLANDLQKGMIDRFRSLPMSQSSSSPAARSPTSCAPPWRSRSCGSSGCSSGSARRVVSRRTWQPSA